jgi:hypothetical protein
MGTITDQRQRQALVVAAQNIPGVKDAGSSDLGRSDVGCGHRRQGRSGGSMIVRLAFHW